MPSEMAVSEGEVKAAEAVAAAPLKADLNSLPIRSYLDQTVVPLLLQGMAQLVCVLGGVAAGSAAHALHASSLRAHPTTHHHPLSLSISSPFPRCPCAARSAPPTP